MIRFILKRILALIPVLLGVSFIIFCLLYFTPGDPAEYMLGMDATEENIQELREELGLNEPFLVQYFNYIKNIVLHFDFGKSYTTKQSVTIELLQRVPATVTLAVLSVAFATIIGVVTGVIAAVKQYSIFDKLATIFALTGVSMPNFWTGLMLIIIFSVKLGWLPPLWFQHSNALDSSRSHCRYGFQRYNHASNSIRKAGGYPSRLHHYCPRKGTEGDRNCVPACTP